MPVRARPQFDKGRNQWTFYFRGKARYLCTGAGNEALAWAKAEQLRGIPLGDDKPPLTVTAAVAAWLRQRGSTWHTWVLDPFAEFGMGHMLTSLHDEYLDDYMHHLEQKGFTRKIKGRSKADTRAYAASTIRKQVSAANRVLQWAHVRGYLPQRPPKMPRLPQEEEVDRSLRPEQVAKVFAVLSKRARKAAEILRFIVLTGCRPAEACELQVNEIRGDICELRRGKTKKRTGKPRLIYLSDDAKHVLERQGRSEGYVFLNRLGKPYKPTGLRSIIRRAAESVGIRITGAYVLRHSFAQQALETADLGEVAELLGHTAGSRMTHRYARIKAERALKAARRVTSLVPVNPANDSVPPKKARRRPTGRPIPAPKKKRPQVG